MVALQRLREVILTALARAVLVRLAALVLFYDKGEGKTKTKTRMTA